MWTATSVFAEKLTEDAIGGKAANLRGLSSLNFDVPPWFCVTAAVFDAIVIKAGPKFHAMLLRADEATDRAHQEEISAELIFGFSGTGLATDQADEILKSFDGLFERNDLVAVRSSAIGEDAAQRSFAGQLESYLFVNRCGLLDRIVACFASAFAPRCLLYRKLHAENIRSSRGAVIVQRMVLSASSGVLFTANPVCSSELQMVLTASYGLGIGVVQDQADADTYILDYANGALIKKVIANKSAQVVAAGGDADGTRVVEVPSVLATLPVLDEHQLAKLYAVGRELDGRLGVPQDIEWAFDSTGLLYVLQTRPITGMHLYKTMVFDNSNISENYQGATTPLTYSYVRKYYEDIFLAAARKFGTTESALVENSSVFANLVAYLNGGLYYNLANWYRMFYLVPGFNHFVDAFEHGVGLGGTPPEFVEQRRRYMQGRTSYPKLVTAWASVLRNYVLLPRMMRQLETRFEMFREKFEALEVHKLPLSALVETFEKIQLELAPKWGAPLINDYYAFNVFLLIDKFTRRWELDEDGALISDLLRGTTELASVEPIRALLELARLAKESPQLAATIEQADFGTLSRIQSDPSFAKFGEALAQYIHDFGDRRFDELKLESPTFKDNPQILLGLVKNYLRRDDVSVVHRKFTQRDAVHAHSRERVSIALRGRPFRRVFFALLVSATQRSLRYREYGRLVRSRRCGIERTVLIEIGRRLAVDGVLEHADDVQYLSIDELLSYTAGSSITCSLRELAVLRKKEFAENQTKPLPRRIVTNRVPYLDLPLMRRCSAGGQNADKSGAQQLRGLGCSPGQAHGRARVIHNPSKSSLSPGDILIAKATDPAWAFLMVAAAGLVVERGNMLSHAAIIGRELGIPCVIGVTDATELIREGQLLTIDGTSGIVSLENSPSANEKRTSQGELAFEALL